METPKTIDIQREMLILKYATYSRIVARKHGIPVQFSVDEVRSWPDEQLATFVESLKDLAHIPPA